MKRFDRIKSLWIIGKSTLFESLATIIFTLSLNKSLSASDRGIYSGDVAIIFLTGFLSSIVFLRLMVRMHLRQELNPMKATKILEINSVVVLSTIIVFLVFCSSRQHSIFPTIVVSIGIFTFSAWLFFHNYSSLFPADLYLLRSNQIYLVFMSISAILIPIMGLSGLECLILWICVNIASTLYIVYKMLKLQHLGSRKSLSISDVLPRKELGKILFLVPVYISIFDALKIDMIIVRTNFGTRLLGLYAVMSSICLVIALLYRIFFVTYLNLNFTYLKNHGSRVIFISFYIILNLLIGTLLAININVIFDLIANNSYRATASEFIILWLGNLSYWSRRLLYELFQNLEIGFTAVASEILSSGLFFYLVLVSSSNSLKDFLQFYAISLIVGFILLTTRIIYLIYGRQRISFN